MLRRVIAGLILAGLGMGIWLLWPTSDTPPSTPAAAGGTDSTSSTADPVASLAVTPDSTTTTTSDSHVVRSVEEAEAILRELWFGWFEGIYNQDEDRIREVVATAEQFQEARALFGTLEFIRAPSRNGIDVIDIEILRSDEGCLAAWVLADASSFRGPHTSGAAVYVIRRVEGRWALTASWRHQSDLWEADCESILQR